MKSSITNNQDPNNNQIQNSKDQNIFLLLIVPLVIIWSLVIGNWSFCYAVTGQAGLDIAVLSAGVGARPLGMGSAFTAVADNVDAPFWNPAGLSLIKDHQLSAMQTKLSSDADQYYISYAQPFLWGGIGISWIQLGTGSLTQTSSTTDAYNEVQNLGIFSFFSNAYMLAYGQAINDKLSFGVTAKYLTSDMPGLVSIEGASAWGYSVTPGLLYKVSDQLTLGLKVDELVNMQKWGTDTEEIAPSTTRFGLAYRMKVFGLPMIFAGDVSQINKAGYVPEGSAGTELTVGQLSFRIGYAETSFTAGAGFKQDGISIDYAYVSQTALTMENVNRVSLTGSW